MHLIPSRVRFTTEYQCLLLNVCIKDNKYDIMQDGMMMLLIMLFIVLNHTVQEC